MHGGGSHCFGTKVSKKFSGKKLRRQTASESTNVGLMYAEGLH